jgi:hypothetical protein
VSAWGVGGFRCASAASASTAASFSDIVMEGSCRLICEELASWARHAVEEDTYLSKNA